MFAQARAPPGMRLVPRARKREKSARAGSQGWRATRPPGIVWSATSAHPTGMRVGEGEF